MVWSKIWSGHTLRLITFVSGNSSGKHFTLFSFIMFTLIYSTHHSRNTFLHSNLKYPFIQRTKRFTWRNDISIGCLVVLEKSIPTTPLLKVSYFNDFTQRPITLEELSVLDFHLAFTIPPDIIIQ